MAKPTLIIERRSRRTTNRELVRIRDRFYKAKLLGWSGPEASKIAHGTGPIVKPNQPAQAAPAPTEPVEPKQTATARVSISGADATAPNTKEGARDRIPPDWHELEWPRLRQLVQEITGKLPRSRQDAHDAIERVLAA